MKRDMDIVRNVMLAIEEQYIDVALFNLVVEGLDMNVVAYHCKILHEGGLISNYTGQFASNKLYSFTVGSLTWDGHEFLDKIRDNNIWTKTKSVAKKKGLPLVLGVVRDVASAIITEMTSAAVKGIIKGSVQ